MRSKNPSYSLTHYTPIKPYKSYKAHLRKCLNISAENVVLVLGYKTHMTEPNMLSSVCLKQ